MCNDVFLPRCYFFDFVIVEVNWSHIEYIAKLCNDRQ